MTGAALSCKKEQSGGGGGITKEKILTSQARSVPTASVMRRRNWKTRFRSSSLTVVLALQCSGCSLKYYDSQGNRHVIGMVDITIHAAATPNTFAGDVVDLTSIGLAASQTAQGGYLSIGYSHEVSASLRDNALVIGDIVHPLTPFGQ